jgi:hypothetical protein
VESNHTSEGKLHLLAECLVSTESDISSMCRDFFKRYFLASKKGIPKTVFQIFCGLQIDKRREVMEALLREFCKTENDVLFTVTPFSLFQNLSALFSSSLRESVDVDKIFVLSLLKPSKKSLEEIKALLSNIQVGKGKTLRGKGQKGAGAKEESRIETPLQRVLATKPEALGFFHTFLASAKGICFFAIGSSSKFNFFPRNATR